MIDFITTTLSRQSRLRSKRVLFLARNGPPKWKVYAVYMFCVSFPLVIFLLMEEILCQKKSSEEMLDEMDANGFEHGFAINDDYKTICKTYVEFIKSISEQNDDFSMFPNGRNFDAEDEDGV